MAIARKAVRLRILGSLAVAAALALPAGSAMAGGPQGPMAYTCTGGAIGSGDYASITVTGFCGVVPNAEITIVGNLNVAAGALLDAGSAPSTITVGHNVTAGAGALLFLGCQPPSLVHNSGHTCTVEPDGHSVITVQGNVTASGANTVMLNGIKVMGNVTLAGGGGMIPWSIKNNKFDGNLTISEVTADWLGVLFNKIGRNATLTNITVTDPGDTGRRAFVVQNTIGWNLTCMGINPGVAGGLFPGEPLNTVGRHALGQCAALAA